MAALAQLSTWRDALMSARYQGIRTVKYGGKRITYATDAKMAEALGDLNRQITGTTSRIAVVRIQPAKSLCPLSEACPRLHCQFPRRTSGSNLLRNTILSDVSMDGETTRQATDLSREEIYALVWERPLNRVGPDLGLDGPRLAKLCDKQHIPYPPPGYWSKKAVGRAPAAPPLPPDADPVLGLISAPNLPSSKQRNQSPHPKPLAPVKETAAPPEAVVSIETAVTVDDDLDPLDKLHPKIRVWIVEHTRDQKERVQENRRRRNDAWSWSKPLLDDLTERDLYRCRASSTLCHAIEKAGAKVKDADIHGKLTFTCSGRDIECVVKEKMSRAMKRPEEEAAKWTAYPHHHNSGLISSGWLRA